MTGAAAGPSSTSAMGQKLTSQRRAALSVWCQRRTPDHVRIENAQPMVLLGLGPWTQQVGGRGCPFGSRGRNALHLADRVTMSA